MVVQTNQPLCQTTHFYFDVFFECDGAMLCMKIIFIIAFGFFLNHGCMRALKKKVSVCLNSYLNTVQNFQWIHDFTICNITLKNISHLPCWCLNLQQWLLSITTQPLFHLSRLSKVTCHSCWRELLKINLHVFCYPLSFNFPYFLSKEALVIGLTCFTPWFRIWHLVLSSPSLLLQCLDI